MIFALDTSATRTGWCLGAPSGPVRVGHALFGGHGSDIGKLMRDFRDWLNDKLDDRTPDMIAFEKPVRPMAKGNLLTFRQLYALTGMVELVAVDRSIPVFEVDNQQMKKTFYGSGGKKPAKAEGLAMAANWGIDCQFMDEADAAGVFIKTVQERFPADFKEWERARSARMTESGERLL